MGGVGPRGLLRRRPPPDHREAACARRRRARSSPRSPAPIKVRPAKHARDPAAFWQPGEIHALLYAGRVHSGLEALLRFAVPDRLHGGRRAAARGRARDAHDAGSFGPRTRRRSARSTIRPGRPRATQELLFFGKRGEFNAIVIANIYIAEMRPGGSINPMARNRILLVKDHHLGHVHMALAAPGILPQAPEDPALPEDALERAVGALQVDRARQGRVQSDPRRRLRPAWTRGDTSG